jgi:hypothetical protein
MTCTCEHPKPDFGKASHVMDYWWEAPCLSCGDYTSWQVSSERAQDEPKVEKEQVDEKQTKLF